MHRSFKFLLRPTSKQIDALTAMLEDHRLLYNAALEERREAWRKRRVGITLNIQNAQLPAIRELDPDQQRWSALSQQFTLRRLDVAFAGFFRRIRLGQKAGYPRFRGVRQFNTVTWTGVPVHGRYNGCRWNSTPDDKIVRVYFKGVGHVRVHQHRSTAGRIKTVTVKREGRRWYVLLACEEVPTNPLDATGLSVGLDVGLASLVTTSDGDQVGHPRHLTASAARLGDAQRALARCQRGSKRRTKVRRRVAAIYAKVARQRRDYAHKSALQIVRRYDLIAHEDLRIQNMLRLPAPRPDGQGGFLPNGASAKIGLNRSIHDAGWGVFLRILHDKAESAGREVVAVNPANTSRTCPACGHCAKENRVTQATFLCVDCGYADHADVVGAVNVLRAGLALRDAPAA